MHRFLTLLALTFWFPLASIVAPAQPAPTSQSYIADFDQLASALRDEYAYHEDAARWIEVERRYRSRVDTVDGIGGFVVLLEEFLEELHDPHAHLTTNTPTSPLLVPSGTDLWAKWIDERATITAVRPSSHASRAGLRAGMRIEAIDGVEVETAVIKRLHGGASTPRSRDWALLALLAGERNRKRRIRASDEKGSEVDVSLQPGLPARADSALIEVGMVQPSIGYVRFNNSLGDVATIAAFDSAVAMLLDVRAIILDLRDTPGGGNTTVARGIMGRLVDRELPYQKHVIPAEEQMYGVRRSWVELVSPRLPTYRGTVVVLVDNWTGSMGEGLAIGLHGLERAAIVGTAMAGLRGATRTITLQHTGIGASFPVEQLYHVNGTPRESFMPDVVVDLARSTGDDPILDAAMTRLR